MRTRGVKVFDPIAETDQLDWLVVPVDECPNEDAERFVITTHFRVPHEPWGSEQAFVREVVVRRSRRRVLFFQESGLRL
jgi:hypothetical protein